jgi:GT2 family glycosyltransferase
MNITEKKVSIIVPNYNGKLLLEKNLPYVIQASKSSKNSVNEIIVVDDGSGDRSVQLIKKEFPQVKLIVHKKNRGFSDAVNTGVRMAQGDLVALLNNDVKPSSNFLVHSIKHFKDKKVFAVSFNEGKYSWAEGYFEDGFVQHRPGPKSKASHISFWASGGSGLFRRDIWHKLGGMDQELYTPYYWEDVDICYRAWKRGYKILWEPKSKVIHKHAQTIKKQKKTKKQRILQRNHLLFIWKNITSSNLIKKHIFNLLKKTVKKPGYIKIVLNALLYISKVKRKRKIEINQSTVSDEAIFRLFNK